MLALKIFLNPNATFLKSCSRCLYSNSEKVPSEQCRLLVYLVDSTECDLDLSILNINDKVTVFATSLFIFRATSNLQEFH